MFRFSPRLFAVALASVAIPAFAAGDLLVAPTRVVLDGPRGTEVFLNNVGQQTATYRISIELKRMLPSGQLEDVAPESANAKEMATLAMITYAPRRVTLMPNQPQAIRIGVRPPADLPDGEYRAHILFRGIPDAAPPPAAGETPRGVSISLTPIYGVTIPIIVRKGSLKATAAISDARLIRDPKDGPSLAFTLSRSGDRSTYGRIRVTKPGIAKPVYEARGIAVYAEIGSRTVSLPVAPEVAAQLSGPAKIEYLEESESGGGMIAEAQVVIR
jgi:P pilus assembly chaperone PapD